VKDFEGPSPSPKIKGGLLGETIDLMPLICEGSIIFEN
jgi:hypothetical protein